MKKQQAIPLVNFLITAFTAFISVQSTVSAMPIVADTSLRQVNWLRPDESIAAENSVWGVLSFSVVPDPLDNYFLNVVSKSGTTSSWSVQNLPLTPFVSGKQAVDINLRDLGFSSGTNVASVDIHISIDSSIRTSEPVGPFTPFDVTDLDRLAWDNYDISGLFDPGEPTGIKLSSAPAPAGGLRAGRDLNVLQEDKSGCFPGSMARSLDWLNRSNGIGNPKTIEEIYSDLAALTGLPPNAPDRELRIERKAAYAEQNFGVKTKAFDALGILDPIFGVPETTPDQTDLIDWLLAEFADGEDIEIAYRWKKISTGETGGHIVAIKDIYKTIGGQTVAIYRDDEHQGKPEGDSADKWAEIIKRPDGTYGFWSSSDKITYAISESVPEPSVLWLLAPGVCVIFAGRRFGRRR
jgi:hypothetical protein